MKILQQKYTKIYEMFSRVTLCLKLIPQVVLLEIINKLNLSNIRYALFS